MCLLVGVCMIQVASNLPLNSYSSPEGVSTIGNVLSMSSIASAISSGVQFAFFIFFVTDPFLLLLSCNPLLRSKYCCASSFWVCS